MKTITDNFGVLLHYGEKQSYFKTENYGEKNNFFKGQSLKKVLGNVFEKTIFNDKFYKDICFRQLLHSQALCEGIPLKKEIEANFEKVKQEFDGENKKETKWRMAIGMGGASIFDTSMTTHHIYGFPYIPGSAVKGLLRSWIITEYFGEVDGKLELKHAEDRALKQSEDFCRIFGCPENSARKNAKGKAVEFMGDIIFFDAYPTKAPTVSLDIMNPHYKPYYEDSTGKVPPADWHNPEPINFLTVKNTSFQFLIGIRKGVDNFDIKIGRHKGKAVTVLQDILTEVLTFNGIGAKTAVGYGRMK